MGLSVGGIVSVGNTGGGGTGNSSGIQSINAQTGPDIFLNGVSGITILNVASNQINIGLTTPYSGIVGGSGIIVEQVGGNFVVSLSGTNSSTITKFAQSFTGISGLFTHSLGTLDIIVNVYDGSSGGMRKVIPDEVIAENLNQASVIFNQPVVNYRIIIV